MLHFKPQLFNFATPAEAGPSPAAAAAAAACISMLATSSAISDSSQLSATPSLPSESHVVEAGVAILKRAGSVGLRRGNFPLHGPEWQFAGHLWWPHSNSLLQTCPHKTSRVWHRTLFTIACPPTHILFTNCGQGGQGVPSPWHECAAGWSQGCGRTHRSMQSGSAVPQATGGYSTAAPQWQLTSSKADSKQGGQ